ncbi:hypothetical protein G6L97_04195 [Agrobacterium tumefaciens]|uniref:hypothetical protein n=1 Tax=Agrobacterium tumefaciens TaxID=358 RepID=UPI001AED852C|nr:hypothetical protein [Agrobacterium tumefaciens]WCA69820.1 hypothetical protein G6L97_04195 [Agrobacterium tumefaciens]
MSIDNLVATAKAISADLASQLSPPEEGFLSKTQPVVFLSLVRGTRQYIENIANQANGAYENGWYDASAVMLRRLVETLIIEAFEHHQIDSKIKNSEGDFFFLRDLVTKTLAETKWNLSRNAKQALPKLKDLGDKSAHSRRYIAQRRDIEPLLPEIRTVVQELVFLSGLKK